MRLIDVLRRALKGEKVEGLPLLVPPPVAELVGFEPVSLEEGSTAFRMTASVAKHANPMGTLHGGILCDLADAAMGMACASTLELGESFTTLELKINFLRPVRDGRLEARARVVHRGASLVYLECDVVKLPEDKLVARSSSTCLVLRGEQAKGR